MKIYGTVICCLQLIALVQSISVLLKEEFNFNTAIFNASLGLKHCQYDISTLNTHGYKDSLLQINKDGAVYLVDYSELNYYQIIEPIKTTIFAKNCEGGLSASYPVTFHIAPSSYSSNLHQLYGDAIQINIKYPEVDHNIHHNWINLIDYSNDDPKTWLPYSLQSCLTHLNVSDELLFRKHRQYIQVKNKNPQGNIIDEMSLKLRCTKLPGYAIKNETFPLVFNLLKPNETSRKRSRSRRGAPIRFSSARYKVDVKENMQIGTPVITLHVLNGQGTLSFSWVAIRNRQSFDMFQLNSSTGKVTTRVLLDRENIAKHLFRVTVTDNANRRAICNLEINVEDVNDNTPKFESTSYSFSVTENEIVDEVIARVNAYDADIGRNSDVTISFRENNHPFKIYNGEISVKSHVDREVKSEYALTLVATDNGLPPKSSSAPILITVLDVNDNSPKFKQQEYSVKVPENTQANTIITTVSATDPDEGGNGRVRYSLLSRGPFSINRNTGAITLLTPLDFERNAKQYHLNVRAQDDGKPPSSSTCIVLIIVEDKNDNKPRFIPPSYSKKIPENLKVRSQVVTVTATDSDSATNSQLTYSIIHSSLNTLPFTIGKTNGIITLSKKLDFEQTQRYGFTVRATDSGGLFGEGYVNINIEDVNDNPPVFSKPVYMTRVQENANINQKIIDIIATDQDSNSDINYWISRGNEDRKFLLTKHGSIAVLTLNGRLDFALKSSYSLTIVASDGDNQQTAIVNIQVIDKNTHRPVFLKTDYEVQVLESVKIGKILQVSATDDDQGENAEITYSLAEPSRTFQIDPKSGKISTKVLLDREEINYYSLRVIASDNGIPQQSGEANVFIIVMDVNDNAPVFDEKEYTAHVEENVAKGHRVVQVSAQDADMGNNRKIDYELVDDANGHFAIDRLSGIIRTQVRPDREHIPKYTLIAKAVDRGIPPMSSTVKVQITVDDLDDNPPQFSANVLTYSVLEDTPVGETVLKLEARDPDEGGNAKIQYEQMQDFVNFQTWDLDYRSGELTLLKELDYETRSNYTIIVLASSTELVSQVTVNILLIDVNDNEPVFQPFTIIFNNYRTYKHNTFPVGSIGKIPAYDPDASSVLKYQILEGNSDNLLLLNDSTGDIQLSRKLDTNREFTTHFQIEVSDGYYKVRKTCTLKVVRIDDEMLANSITVRVHETAQEQFLSEGMDSFVEGLSQILNVSMQDIFIFNVNNDTDVLPNAVVNVSFSARHRTGYFFSSQYLQEQVYLNRSLLSTYSMQSVLPFDDNICLREPCENYKRCVSALQFNGSAPFMTTDTMLFRPIHPINGLRCKCPTGFVGLGCENEVNLCYPNPCGNEGTCISVEGGYHCVCKEGFAGDQCELDTIGGRCASDVCKNEMPCIEHLAGGFACDCSSLKSGGIEDFTSYCQLRSRSFQKGNFVMFSGITNQWRFKLSLSFSTLEPNGLLMYNGRFNHKHDYFALEIINGQVQLNFSTGQVSTIVDPYIAGGVNDGQWHTVLIDYQNKPNREVNNNNDRGPSKIKQVTVTIDPDTCDPTLATSWKDAYGEFTCSKMATQQGTKRSLDLTTPLLLGGVPDLPEEYQVRSRSYVGCMRDLIIEHKLIDFMGYVANQGTKPGCSSMTDVCTKDKCFNNARCIARLDSYKCACSDGFAGKRCERERDIVNIDGSNYLTYPQVTQLPRLTLPFTQTLGFRTTRDGTILYTETSSPLFLKIELAVEGGYLRYNVRVGNTVYTTQVPRTHVDNGTLHQVEVTWKKLNNNLIEISVNLDNSVAMGYLNATMPTTTMVRSELQNLVVGARLNTRRTGENVFKGCIQGIELKFGGINKPIPMRNLITKSRRGPTLGCNIPNPCSRQKCPIHSDCVANFDQAVCHCHKGYIGNNCVSICSALSPCSENGVCLLNASSSYGYSCRCKSELYYGRTCELEHLQPCPPGWLGYPVCTPCNCPVERNFDVDCASNNGACVCKKNHFYDEETGMCEPCNCYHLGSSALNCTSSGQCGCKTGVIDKTCSRCTNKFAEITDNGCEVVYEKCPRSLDHNMLWTNAHFGEWKPSKCPPGSKGFARRFCEKSVGWHDPILSDCTSDLFYTFYQDLSDLELNRTTLSSHYSIQIARRLKDAAVETNEMYRSDVNVTYHVLLKLLEYQNQRKGFDLASAQDEDFNENILAVTSRSMVDENSNHWSTLQKQSVNSAMLLKSYEDYMSVLTASLGSMFYDDLDAVSDNIHMQIKLNPLVQNDQKINIDMSINGTSPEEELALVTYAPKFLDMGKAMPNETTAVGVMQFRNLGNILPMMFFDDGRNMRIPKKPFVNSPVVVVVAHDNTNTSRLKLYKGDWIEITFPLLRSDQSSPQCVFWDFKTRSPDDLGGWSSKNCSKTKENSSHVTCECSHLTTFAIITDEEIVSAVSALPVAIALYTSVLIVVGSVIALIVCYIALSDVKSNHAAIHVNYGAAVLFSEGLYVAGIQQTINDNMCMAVAIFLHFFFMSIISWLFVEGLHLYRMIQEKRNINYGRMWVYYLFGWGFPAITTALSVGLNASGFGNTQFCWITIDDLLVWSFLGPMILCIFMYILLFSLSIQKYFSLKLKDAERKETRANLRTSFILVPLSGGLWALALFAVNQNKPTLYFLFSLVNVVLGLVILFFHCIFNNEIRTAFRNVKDRKWKQAEFNSTQARLLPNTSLNHTLDSQPGNGMVRYADIPTNPSSTTSASVHRNHVITQNSSMFHDVDNTDSDSDSSRSSFSLASTHSSDEEDDAEDHRYFKMDWKRTNGHPPHMSGNGGLQVHSTPKEDQTKQQLKLSYTESAALHENNRLNSPLPTVTESPSEENLAEAEQDYLAITRSDTFHRKETKDENDKSKLIPMEEYNNSLPKKGILKTPKSKPPIPARNDSLRSKINGDTAELLRGKEQNQTSVC